jgi:hypothetical protein
MDCSSFFQRQRAILFSPVSGSGATIGQKCTIVEIDPTSRYLHPTDATHWRVCVFLPHVPEYRVVYARDLMGLQERDDSLLPPPDECRAKQVKEAPNTKEVPHKELPKWVELPPPATSQIPSQYNGVIAGAVFVGLLWIAPYVAMVVAAGALLIFIAAIVWSALRHKQRGWWLGVLFCLLLLTMPLWVSVANALFARFLDSPTSIP